MVCKLCSFYILVLKPEKPVSCRCSALNQPRLIVPVSKLAFLIGPPVVISTVLRSQRLGSLNYLWLSVMISKC